MFFSLQSEESQTVSVGIPAWWRGGGTGRSLPQTLHNMLDVAGVDVVSLQQAAVAGALHSQLEETAMISDTLPPDEYSDAPCGQERKD